MFDVVTFGSASQDISFKSKDFLPLSGKIFTTGKGICLNLGSKVEVENIFISSGGGGTNTAATFANQGFKTAFCGAVGNDLSGDFVIKELKKFGIDTSLISRHKSLPTNLSVVLTWLGRERTILTYHGASDALIEKDIPWSKIKKTKWFYLAPFSDKLTNLTEKIINFAKLKKIKIAFNPGYNQLNLPSPVLKRILNKIDILILNREEASLVSKIPYRKEKEIFDKIDKMMKGILVMTKGEEGVMVSAGKNIYRAESLHLKLVDATGAGDAFGSGFVSGLMKKNNIEYAIQLAMANSGYAITKWGAKEGILTKNKKWKKVKVKKSFIQ